MANTILGSVDCGEGVVITILGSVERARVANTILGSVERARGGHYHIRLYEEGHDISSVE